jgi:opacity protein-like surface antigen
MTRTFLLLIVALMFAPAALAQDYSRYEFYVGYAHERANNGADTFDNKGKATFNGKPVDFRSRRVDYNGFDTEFNQNLNRHIGIVASFSGTYHTTNFVDNGTGRQFRARVQRYDILAGPRYNWRTGAVTPFAHALFGVSYMRAKFEDTLASCPKSDVAFAMAFGAGLDVHATDRIDVRAIQVDYVPTYFHGRRQDNIRASAGIKIK